MKGQYSVALQKLIFEPPENPTSEHDGLFVSKPLLSMSRSIATSFELYPSNFTIITSAHASVQFMRVVENHTRYLASTILYSLQLNINN